MMYSHWNWLRTVKRQFPPMGEMRTQIGRLGIFPSKPQAPTDEYWLSISICASVSLLKSKEANESTTWFWLKSNVSYLFSDTCKLVHSHDAVITWMLMPRDWPFVCAANSPITGEFPSQTTSHDLMFLLYGSASAIVNKQSSGWWFETAWRSCDVTIMQSARIRREDLRHWSVNDQCLQTTFSNAFCWTHLIQFDSNFNVFFLTVLNITQVWQKQALVSSESVMSRYTDEYMSHQLRPNELSAAYIHSFFKENGLISTSTVHNGALGRLLS